MPKKILLTSFETWLAHQPSNSSDDLLLNLQTISPSACTFLRKLPVDTTRAAERAIAAVKDLQPEVIICCGMAESRYLLTVESNATWTHERLVTTVNLQQLVKNLSNTAISHNAGKFVCEGLYYQVLNYLSQFQPQVECIFVHIPVFTATNIVRINRDFEQIIKQLSGSPSC